MSDNHDYYSLIPDPARCLTRIGLNPEMYSKELHPDLPDSLSAYSAPHTKETLDTIVKAFLYNVPFENLDIFDLRREVSLCVEDVYEKIVIRKRGGYCFELNALMFSLIESLGFSCYPVAQRILLEGPFPPFNHRSTIVTLPNGSRCLCDCGFAGPAPITAVYLDKRGTQDSGKYQFRIDYNEQNGDFCLVRLLEYGEQRLILFKDEMFEQVDFVPLSSYMVHNVTSRFYNNRVLNILRETGSVAIDNDILRIHENGILTEKTLESEDEFFAACMEYFGIQEDSIEELRGHIRL